MARKKVSKKSMKKKLLLFIVFFPCKVMSHESLRAPREPESAGIEVFSLTPQEESSACCTLPRDLNIEGNTWVGGNVTVVGSIFGIFVPSDPLILQPLSGNQFCIIYKQSDGLEKARMCSSAVALDKGLFISVDGGITQNFRVNNAGATQIAIPSSGIALGVVGNPLAPALTAIGNNTTTAPALTLISNPAAVTGDFLLAIAPTGQVTQTGTVFSNYIRNGCQTGSLSIGTNNSSTLSFSTNGCVNTRMTIGASGNIEIAQPSTGVGLTIVGGGETVTSGNFIINAGSASLPVATSGSTTNSFGLIELGGANTSTTNNSIFNIGTRNLFMGRYSSVPNVTGIDNIAIGNLSNSSLTINSTIITIGASTIASGSNSIALGDSANTTVARALVIGSRDASSSGAAPTVTGINGIAIGTASVNNRGARALNVGSIAIGGADTTNSFVGASVTGNYGIALGLNAIAAAAGTISCGSGSGTASGVGANATQISTIVFGSANGTTASATATGVGSIAIGGANGIFAGARAAANRALVIGLGGTTNSDATVTIGSASGVAGGLGSNTAGRTAIALGSAQGTLRGANSGNTSTVAIGGSDSVFVGAAAQGTRSIALGLNANTGGTGGSNAITIGSASGTAGGLGPVASAATAIAIGGAQGTFRGAVSSSSAAIAIGSSDGALAGASAANTRSVAIGTGASVATNDYIILGSSALTAVKVGIGTSLPTAKLTIIGTDGTPVLILNQANTGIRNAPIWLNRSTSVVAGTPIHRDGSNRLFGFTSSARYKTNIRAIKDESEIVYKLKPVFYDPKEGYGQGRDIPGFIAEDVYEDAPSLVLINKDAVPENVAYSSLHALIIRELQKNKMLIDKCGTTLQEQWTKLQAALFALNQIKVALKIPIFEFK